MRPSEELFTLIQSLTAAEKKNYLTYIKSLNNSKEPKYLKLFNYLGTQREYNLERIQTHFKGEKFLKQLNVTKKYLYDSIIRSLVYHNGNDNISNRIERMLKEYDILFSKGLIELAGEVLSRAKSIALKYDEYLLLMTILMKEIRIVKRLNIKNQHAEFIRIYNEYEETYTRLGRIYKLDSTIDRITAIQDSKGIPFMNKEDLEQFVKEFSGEIYEMENYSKPQTVTELEKSYYARYKYFASTMENEKVLYSFNEIISLYEKNPDLIKHKPIVYHTSLMNYTLMLMRLNMMDKIEANFEKHESFKAELSKNGRRSMSETVGYDILAMRIDVNSAKGDFEKNTPYIQSFAAIMSSLLKKNLAYHINHCFAIAYSCFGIRDYPAAIKWLNLILSYKNNVYRDDLMICSHILLLIIHHEMGNYEFVEYEIYNVYRMLKRRNTLYKTEITVLGLLRELIKTDSERKIMEILSSYFSKLSDVLEEEKEFSILNTIDIISFIQSKLNKVSFGEAIKARWGYNT